MFAFLRKTGRVERLIEKQRRRYYLKNNLLSLYATLRLARNPQAAREAMRHHLKNAVREWSKLGDVRLSRPATVSLGRPPTT